ncbi:MAG: iron permease [Caldilineae bacterium]|nr:MAG: iron permease [Caldilineae bacterium]
MIDGTLVRRSGRFVRFTGPLLALLLLLISLSPVAGQSSSLDERLHALALAARSALQDADSGDMAALDADFDQVHSQWVAFEDAVRTRSPEAYMAVEGALNQVEDALQARPVDVAQVEAALDRLADEADRWAGKIGGAQSASGSAETTIAETTIAQFSQDIAAVSAAIARGDAVSAQTALNKAIQAWPTVEGAVAAKSTGAYEAIEDALGQASGSLRAQPADLVTAGQAVERLSRELAPFAVQQKYTWVDAAAILLREGMETLLVLMALLAFLKRSNAEDKRVWIWGGSAAGLAASIAMAFGLQALFSRAAAGQNREIVEGVTGIGAAVLLFYVSYWLHSKSSLKAWNAYIKQHTTQALARGSLWGLGVLAFLSVLREGAETVIFYLGMAPSIAPDQLALGLSVGAGVLAIAALLMHFVGLKLPLRPFFFVASLLVYYLGFKFLGAGIHALQVAGMLPQSPVALAPTLPVIGLYATWETLAPQALLLLATLWLVLGLQSRVADGSGEPTPPASA